MTDLSETLSLGVASVVTVEPCAASVCQRATLTSAFVTSVVEDLRRKHVHGSHVHGPMMRFPARPATPAMLLAAWPAMTGTYCSVSTSGPM